MNLYETREFEDYRLSNYVKKKAYNIKINYHAINSSIIYIFQNNLLKIFQVCKNKTKKKKKKNNSILSIDN